MRWLQRIVGSDPSTGRAPHRGPEHQGFRVVNAWSGSDQRNMGRQSERTGRETGHKEEIPLGCSADEGPLM